MSVYNFANSVVAGAAGQSTDFYPVSIDQSLRFNDADSAYLTYTPSTSGNQKKWTFSAWVKRGNLGTQQGIFSGSSYSGNDGIAALYFYTDDTLYIYYDTSGANPNGAIGPAVYRDTSAWYHIVWAVDAVNTEHKIWVNNQLVSTDTGKYPPNFDYGMNRSGSAMGIGAKVWNPDSYLDGYMAEVHYCDDQYLTPDSFGELKSGVWVAKTPSVTYGTNGFYLDFANSADIGNDVSGEGNDWTPSIGLTASDVVLDSPTDNFATLNPLLRNDTLSPVLSDGNLAITASSSAWMNGASTIGMSSGQWYFEVNPTVKPSVNNYYMIGLCEGAQLSSISYTGSSTNSWGYFGDTGVLYNNGGISSFGATYTLGDTIGVAFDADAGTLEFFKNNVSQGTVSSIPSGEYFFCSGVFAVNYQSSANFGQLGFTYTPPTDYLALSTANLPEPTISPADDASPEDYFGTLLWSGDDNATRTVAVGQSGITGDVNFTPDFTWVKRRNGATNGSDHMLLDVVRGVGTFNALSSNGTSQEGQTEAGSAWANFGDIDSFTTDGFVVQKGSDPSHTLEGINQTGGTYVAWNWKANGSATLNDQGTIDSQVSANTESGFSIVKYTSPNTTNEESVGHGLTDDPDFVIIKNRDDAYNWDIWHKDLTQGSGHGLIFTTAAETSGRWPNTVIDSVNKAINLKYNYEHFSTNDYIAYCFHSVEGFSKFGSYTGNGDPDGPFVYTGFRPAFVLIKNASTTGTHWLIWDDKRSVYNVTNDALRPALSNAEAVNNSSYAIDILSNGFKARSSYGDVNQSDNTIIYMAFAEDGGPFKYSNAR